MGPDGLVMLGTAETTHGGVATLIGQYRRALALRGWQVRYVVTHREGAARRKAWAGVRALGCFAALLAGRRASACHVHLSTGASLWRKCPFAILAHFLRVPVLLHVHGGRYWDYANDSALSPRRRLVCWLLVSAERVMVPTPRWAARLADLAPGCRTAVVPYPIRLRVGARPPEPDAPVLVFVGRIWADKGIWELVRALETLAGEFPALRLRVCGDGESDRLARECRERGLEGRVEYLGWLGERGLDEAFEGVSGFVLPSYVEGLPLSMLEAMSRGVPVIVTPVGGIPDVVAEGVEGFLVPPRDVVALADAIARLLRDEGARRRMGAAARERIAREYAEERAIACLEEQYRGLGMAPDTGMESSPDQ